MFDTLVEAAAAIAAGVLSPRELIEDCLDRIERSDAKIRAFNHVDHKGSLSQGDRLTEEAARGELRGPLHGIPFAVKDVVDVEGLPTTASSKLLADNTAAQDAPVVAAVRRAGGVIVGKTNLDEFAYGVFSPPTVNPWDPSRVPGGSSGGSAAALATGMCLGALGTDTAGSIRIPSALCGVAGLKPRRHVVTMEGVIPLSPSLDVCGPMARNARDLSVIWNVMWGPISREDPAPVEVGIADPGELNLDADVAEGYESFLDSVAAADGVRAEVTSIPALDSWERSRGIVLMAEALEVHRRLGFYPARADDYSAPVRASFEYAERITDSELVQARLDLDRLEMELRRLLEDRDALVLPTTPCVAPSIAEASKDIASRRTWVRRLTRFAAALNCCDVAVASIPGGVTAEGLPWAVDLVGRTEVSVLDLAQRVSRESHDPSALEGSS